MTLDELIKWAWENPELVRGEKFYAQGKSNETYPNYDVNLERWGVGRMMQTYKVSLCIKFLASKCNYKLKALFCAKYE